jgi:hypothetical protein
VRRHPKASSAGPSTRQATRLGRSFRGAFATRDASSDSKGSSAASSFSHALLILCFTGALVIALCSAASAAVAPKGVTGFFGTTPGTAAFGTAAGQMNIPRGVAVNQGNGNVYAVDATNNRVVAFNSSGAFLRAFGADVVAFGPGQANEAQAIDVNAASGNFKLTFSGQTTSELAATASSAEVQAALNALTTIGGLEPAGSVTVTGGPGSPGGTSPYRITFGGSLAATNVSQISAVSAASPNQLAGGTPATAITVATVRDGAIGFEICVPANGDGCKAGVTGATGGAMSTPQGIAVNQSSGDVYITEQGNLRVQQFDSSGNFLRAFGQDVVTTGFPGNSAAASAVQTLTVTATAGKYKLKFGGKETAELPYNATAAEIQAALQGLTSIGAANVIVSGAGPYTITFAGALANNPEPLITIESGPGEPLVGGTATVVNTAAGATGFEVCVAANNDACKIGVTASTGGAFKSTFNGFPAVAPTGAANAGDVLVADPANLRVQEFTAAGAFVRAFGQDVVSAGPDNNAANFEVCSLAAGDACKIGITGSGSGQFATNTPTRVAEDASGNLYTVETAANFRVQKFLMPAPSSVAVTASGPFDAADLTGSSTANAPTDVAVNPTAAANVLVTKAFAAAATPSCPITGAASVAESRVLEVSSGGTLEGTHGTCAAITPANGLAARQSTGDLYLSSTFTASRLYVLNTGQPLAPTASITNVSGVGAHAATISAFVNPNGPELPYGQETTYKFEFKRSADPTYTLLGSGEASAGNRTTNKLITQPLEGLQAATSYDVRLVATKPFGSGSATSAVTFSTPAAAPEPIVAPSVYLDGTTAKFGGAVNPNNSPTTYHFEYVGDAGFQASGFAGATSVPSPDASAGSGGTAVSVAKEATGLDRGTTYHLRLVATSGAGSAASAPTTFTVEASGTCANEALRKEQVSTTLPAPIGTTGMPACMALEMASPPAKENQPVKNGNQQNNSISVDGEHVLFRTGAALGETAGVVDVAAADVYVASRNENGWTTRATILRQMNLASEPRGLAPDLSSWFQIAPETGDLNSELKYQAWGSTLGGSATAFSSLLVTPDAPQNIASYAGSSADASHLYIKTGNQGAADGARFLPNDPKPAGEVARNNVYVLALGEDGQPAPMQLLARDRFGKAWGANCGARVGGDINASLVAGTTSQRVRVQGAISADGSRVYFSARPSQPAGVTCNGTNNRMRILERAETLAGPEISELAQNECTRIAPACDATDGDDYFQGASADGNRVYFVTNRQLVNSDLDSGAPCGLGTGQATGCDLYLYEKLPGGGHKLVQVSAGDATDPTPGAGAKVLNNIAGISTDGSHVYFAAEGVLTTKPNELGAVAKAGAGQINLYLYERDTAYPSGRTVFVGALATQDTGELWGATKIEAFGPSSVYPVPAMDADGKIGGDGHVLLFRSKAGLTPNDTDASKRDVYRYDSQTGSLQCVSCLPGSDENAGEAKVAEEAGLTNAQPQGPAFASLGRWVSEDGNSLVFQTVAPLLPSDTDLLKDEYLWRDGQLTRLPGADLEDAPTISGEGSAVLIDRTEQLLPQDGDSVADVYVLRSGGGFPIPPVKEICVGERCQEPFHDQPSPSTAASETASGDNVIEPAPCKKGFVRRKGKCVPAPCKKGFVRRKGKCVKRHSTKKHHSQKNRAAGNRQGGLK